jgi:phage terminase large subunit-like protein
MRAESTARALRYAHDPVAFIDDLVRVNELGKPFRLEPHQREVLRLAFAFDEDGRLPWDTVVYACPKKSGKTAINAAIVLWFAFTQEVPNELYLVANDLEQAHERVFKTLVGLLRKNESLGRSAHIQARQILLTTETTMTALASEYSGAAGSNHGLVSFDELWAYTSERSLRLYEELTPVPTRLNSLRFITTYAGWEGESTLLWDLYKQGVGKEEHPEGQGERLHPELPIYANREARLLVYWDHEARLPWQTPTYYAAQQRSLRPATFLRLHRNQWVVAETTFITPELWDPCVDASHRAPLPSRQMSVYAGVDAGVKHDNAAVVAMYWEDETLCLAKYRIWQPSPAQPLDLEATIEAYLRELHQQFWLRKIYCDPYQLHRTITTLHASQLPIEEFPQTVANTTRMGQQLFDLLNGQNLRLYRAADLRQQALQTVAIETPRGFRIAKEKASRKIDGIVALAMSCVAAVEGKAAEQWSWEPVGT